MFSEECFFMLKFDLHNKITKTQPCFEYHPLILSTFKSLKLDKRPGQSL